MNNEPLYRYKNASQYLKIREKPKLTKKNAQYFDTPHHKYMYIIE